MTDPAGDQPQRRRGGERHKGRGGAAKIQQLAAAPPQANIFADVTVVNR
jgi:hypothetical protein